MNIDLDNRNIRSICIVRLSAIGDVTHMLPIIHSIHKFRPDINITWIIGSTEYKLVGDLPRVEFIQFNKRQGWVAYRQIREQLADRQFDVVIAAQVSLRANLLTALLKAPRKIGYDKQRSKDLHSLVINERILPAHNHVLDSFFQFIEHIGIPHKNLNWQLPISDEDEAFAEDILSNNQRILAISPCSSHSLRNWHSEQYANIANYAHEQYDMQALLLGGNSELEDKYGNDISRLLNHTPINLIGKDTLKKLLALLKRCTVLLTPDSGPAHMATCVDTPVIALHAASNPLRSGPYLSQDYCVNKYPEAAIKYCSKSEKEIKWGTKIEKPNVMSLITEEDVIIKLDQLMNTL